MQSKYFYNKQDLIFQFITGPKSNWCPSAKQIKPDKKKVAALTNEERTLQHYHYFDYKNLKRSR
jgi:hypothetical protein